ncbi:protease modulator HflK [Tundrisphaera lichenicola]|uniref:protease modulator HflK n=1 Tax=Tundrisphaera lichenicola TaxID=2029860 RepID=UPI003EB7AC4E
MSRMRIGSLLVGFLTILIAWSGWTTVEPGEVVVVRRLGRTLPEPWGPGPHWIWPLGIDRSTRLRLDEVRRLEFGLPETSGPLNAPGDGEYLTGDLNILRARGVVQYRVSHPISFVLRSEDRDRLLVRMTEASATRALATRGIDQPLRSGRSEIAREIQTSLASSADALDLGVSILGINLTDARPPIEVEPAFAEAQSAQSERDRKLVEAASLARNMRPATLASAGTRIDEANARASRSAEMARAQAGRFLTLLAEADRSRPLTIRRLYRDALRELMPRVRRKILMTPDEPVDLGLFGSGNSDQ